MEIMGGICMAPPDRNLTINVEYLTLYVINGGASSQMRIKLDWRHFQIMGPSAMVKLLEAVLISAIESFEAVLSEPNDLVQAQRCREQTEIILHSLKSTFFRIPDTFSYLIKNTSDLFSIDFDLEINYS
jgi:hypothetical protein